MVDHLAPTLLKAYNWVVQKREILPSWREAIISVILKEGKERLEGGNFLERKKKKWNGKTYILMLP